MRDERCVRKEIRDETDRVDVGINGKILWRMLSRWFVFEHIH